MLQHQHDQIAPPHAGLLERARRAGCLLEELLCGERQRIVGCDQGERGTIAVTREQVTRAQHER